MCVLRAATTYWDMYYLVQEENMTIADLWDGSSLRCTSRELLQMS